MPKHEPWYKPRDENGDEELINRLGKRDPRYDRSGKGGNGRNNGGCAVLLLAGSGVLAAVATAASVAIQHFT